MPVFRGYSLVIAAAVLWGLSGTAAKYLFASGSLEPFLLVQVRMGLAFLILVSYLAFTAPGSLRPGWVGLGSMLVWSVGGVAAMQFTYLLTISETNVATAIFLQYLAPILTALWGWLAEGEQPGKGLLASLSLAMAGSYLLVFGLQDRLLVSPLGLASGLASALAMAFYTIYGAKRVDALSPLALLCHGLGLGTGFWLVVDLGLLAFGRTPVDLASLADPSLWPFLLYIATLATIVPFGLYLAGLRSISPTHATLTGMLEPVVGGLAAYLLLGERLQPVQLAGGALIILAVVLVQTLRPKVA